MKIKITKNCNSLFDAEGRLDVHTNGTVFVFGKPGQEEHAKILFMYSPAPGECFQFRHHDEEVLLEIHE